MRIPAKADDIVEIYADESSQNKHRYLVLGAIVIPMLDTPDLIEAINKARLPELPQGEAKWTKVSQAKLAAYKRITDVFFDNQERWHFHSLFVDTTQQNHKKFNDGDNEIGFNKELYQLANKVGQLYSKAYFHLYPDYRDTKSTPEELRQILCHGARKRGDPRDWFVRRCQFRDSKRTMPLQLVDILIGAIAYQLNGHDRAEDANPAKVELGKYIMARAGIGNIANGTARVAKFSVWPRKLRK
ncbi:DUF3800 domain-containing protein [Bradyrhizobium sp. TM239]|uniref:DUF3800 domain-containing protein n=1 Tax=Bradyrhizobium sp. TM239 TaxID=2599802 RepID=UPI0027D4E9AE|nr:DUF3800 domain-containing protein [Bradyrhizobium sp. TM239]